MSAHNDKETIALAVKSLERGIEKLLQRASTKKPQLDYDRARKRVQRLLHHIEHILEQLSAKRKSLEALIKWFASEWNDRLQTRLTSEPENVHRILSHALQCLVRCQDGIVLLTSGECRHPVDIREAKATRFPSRLTSIDKRADGYTKLYSGEAYSGFGWDEYANETVGLQARLVHTLRPFHKDPWTYLEANSFTELLETILDTHEVAVKNLKQSLHETKMQMDSDITKRLAKPTSFTTQDKMEKLQVVVPAKGARHEQKISVTRRANSFQIVGWSVLPNDFNTVVRWKRHLGLDFSRNAQVQSNSTETTSSTDATTSRARKRRRVTIVDDTDSEGEEKPPKKETSRDGPTNSVNASYHSTGMEIKVENQGAKTESENSLKAIKTQMGIDVKGWELARQELEHESSACSATRPLSYEEEEVRRLSKILERAEQRKSMERDENEIWDARECLRQACMELGNEALWSAEPKSRKLKQALSSFEQAKELVFKQQKAHDQSVAKTNDWTEDSRLITRNLFFLVAQASTNAGIARIEIFRDGGSKKKQLKLGICELRRARASLSDMRTVATTDLAKCLAHSEQWINIKGDILEADKLESLACRWLGIALWNAADGSAGSFNSAEKILVEGWLLFRGFNVARRSQLLQQLMEIATEAMYATSTLADLACARLETIDRRNTSLAKEHGEQFLDMVSRALTKQAEILATFENLIVESETSGEADIVERVCRYQRNINLSSSHDIKLSIQSVRDWWAESLKRPMENLVLIDKQDRQGLIGRSDINQGHKIPDTAKAEMSGPTYVVIEGSRWRKLNQSQQLNATLRSNPPPWQRRGDARSNALLLSQARAEDSSSTTNQTELATDRNHSLPVFNTPNRFRKWGDEILELALKESERETDTRV